MKSLWDKITARCEAKKKTISKALVVPTENNGLNDHESELGWSTQAGSGLGQGGDQEPNTQLQRERPQKAALDHEEKTWDSKPEPCHTQAFNTTMPKSEAQTLTPQKQVWWWSFTGWY